MISRERYMKFIMYWDCRWKWRVIIAVNFPISAIGRKKAEKYQGFNGIRTRDLCDTGAMLDQLSCEVTHWERGQCWVHIFSCSKMMWKIYEIHIVLRLGMKVKSDFQLLTLANLLRWSLFTLNDHFSSVTRAWSESQIWALPLSYRRIGTLWKTW